MDNELTTYALIAVFCLLAFVGPFFVFERWWRP